MGQICLVNCIWMSIKGQIKPWVDWRVVDSPDNQTNEFFSNFLTEIYLLSSISTNKVAAKPLESSIAPFNVLLLRFHKKFQHKSLKFLRNFKKQSKWTKNSFFLLPRHAQLFPIILSQIRLFPDQNWPILSLHVLYTLQFKIGMQHSQLIFCNVSA